MNTKEAQKLAEDAFKKLVLNRPLNEEESEVTGIVLSITLAGGDPRRILGVRRRRGAPESASSDHRWLSMHYWFLRTEAKELDVVARKIVAEKWGVSESQVYQVALKQKTKAQRMMRLFKPGEFVKLIDGFNGSLSVNQGN